MRRRTPIALAAATLLLALPACDDAAFSRDGDGGPLADVDAGSFPPPATDDGGAVADGSAGDAGPQGADAGVPGLGESEFDDDSSLDAAGQRAGCFDGVDNDGDGLSDCADDSCQANVPSCCVGKSSATCCPEGEVERLALEGCVGELASCADPSDVAVFGSPAPTVRSFTGEAGDALVPGGRETDSGALLLRSLDPRSGALTVSASIASPLTAPASGRVETVGVGFVDATTDPADITRVSPSAAVVVSRNRGEILLVVAGEVVRRFDLPSDAAHTYELTLDPVGRVRLGSDAGVEADVALRVNSPVRAIVYGRTENPTATEPSARVLDVSVTPRVCDMPAALGRPDATSVPAPGDDPSWTVGVRAVTQPHVLRYEDPPGSPQVRMVLDVDGELHLAEPAMGGFVLVSRIGEPVLEPAESWSADGVSDPALLWVDGALRLIFTGWEDGQGTIGRATWDATTERFVVDGPIDGLTATPDASYSAASPFDAAGDTLLAVRVDDASGHRIAIFGLSELSAFSSATVRAPDATDVFAFDHDEVDDPAVVFHDDVYRLYFAGRRGTRWSIGVLVSDDGAMWRLIDDAPALAADGTGFDALGARGPAPDVTGDAVWLYYAGDDGRVIRIGLASPR